MTDILRDLGPIFLGSRLKRLAERMQAGAARMIEDAGLGVQPAHMPCANQAADLATDRQGRERDLRWPPAPYSIRSQR